MTHSSRDLASAAAQAQDPAPAPPVPVLSSLPSSLSPPNLPSRLLTRGESVIGFAGIALATILLATVAGIAWWSGRRERETWQFVRGEQIRIVSTVLAHSAESMLADGDVSALRRLLVEARQEHDLKQCRIVLPDGQVIADAAPSRITLVALPARWPAGPVDSGGSDSNAAGTGDILLDRPLLVPGRGPALLSITASSSTKLTEAWQVQAELGAIGAAALAALLLVYRRLRARLVPLGVLRESLLAAGEGNVQPESLFMRGGEISPEAQAWNQVVERAARAENTGLEQRVKAAFQSQRETRNDLVHACDALSVGMVVVDMNLKVKHVNGAAAVLLRANREQVAGADSATVFADERVREALRAIVAGGGGGGQRRMIEVRHGEQDGGGILRFGVRSLRREDQGGALVTIEDVTQQRVADAARNSFVAQATHELRTPLTNMRLCLEAASEAEDASPEVLREHFNRLNIETRRLERMIGEMLSLTEIEAGSLRLKKDDVRLDAVIEQLRPDYAQQAAEKKLSLTFELPPKLPVFQGDQDKLALVLHNLLGNALKYTPAGGRVMLAAKADGAQLTVTVTDTGIGVAPEEQQQIFERFYRAKDPRVAKITGTGLGLALAREIARLHNGEITVQSELDRGSTFTLTLPTTPSA
jgi:signal transduction histidine kinase